jgi:hypothetical protein
MMSDARIERLLGAVRKTLISLSAITVALYTTVQVAQNISAPRKSTTATVSIDLASLDTDYLKEAVIEW